MRSSFYRAGFTLVELIVVILLVAIVSLYASSRYIGVSSVSAYAIQDQVISVIRQVQVNRMQSNVDSSEEHFELALQTNCLGSVEACSGTAAGRSDVVDSDNISFSSTPSTSVVTFDLLGNPENAASAGVSILISGGQSQASVCINEQGYVYAGACQ
ncbi:type II secretion system protein [Vibrio paucivorans]|uniref:Type II secretion system GspH family protein n=1 Tax=Vibrio paucivorans TaxID=2829489 RepID=A0A9X3CBW3_9VIBR|nr:type II secretion system protein [Vibrio paucivorans]MCW8332459.1 type II secretion system GspH family protein [Vibrio paucivorans]